MSLSRGRDRNIVGIYNEADKSLLERCPVSRLAEALEDWKQLGFVPYIGAAFKNLLPLYPNYAKNST